MYVILVYDINVARVSRVLKVGRRYLAWVQNSVLEGALTWAQLARLKAELKEIIDEDEDSVLIYVLRTEKWLERQQLGKPKGGPKWVV